MRQYFEEETEWGGAVWEGRVIPAMRTITADVLRSATASWHPHPGGFQLFGFDFMMDADLNVWLLEVPPAPSPRARRSSQQGACFTAISRRTVST